MAKKDPINTTKVYTRIPDPLDEAFGYACTRARISRPRGFARAIAQWVGVSSPEADWDKLVIVPQSPAPASPPTIIRNPNRPTSPLSPTVVNVLQQMVSMGAESARILEESRQGESDGGDGDTNPGEEELRKIRELAEEHPGSKTAAPPDAGKEKTDRRRKKG